MKLIQCSTCGKEIAKNAKICPGCGAKNKRPGFMRVVWVGLGVIAFFAVIGTMGENSGMPACDSFDAIYDAKMRFAECYSLNGGDEIKDIQNPTEVSFNEEKGTRSCSGTVVTSQGRTYPANYNFSTLTDGTRWVDIVIQTPSGTNYSTCTR